MSSGVSPDLAKVIVELQSLPSFSKFALAGGTNLAFRYSHRTSIDADFVSTEVVGRQGLEQIIGEVKSRFGEKLQSASIINQDLGDQYMFVRMFINLGDEVVKVELLQNMKCLFDWEGLDGIKLVDKRDIGLFKLMSATNRFARKDIYDLDFITDEVPLPELFNQLAEKRKKFNKKEDECLFDLDVEKDLLEFPEMLLEFDTQKNTFEERPSHSHDRIDVLDGSRSWTEAKINWRMKVRRLFSALGRDFPNTEGTPIYTAILFTITIPLVQILKTLIDP